MTLIPKQKRHKKRRKENDFISQLPDHLIYSILLRLTTKESVKTSILSQRWRYLWKHVPALDLSYTDFRNHHDHSIKDFVKRFLRFEKKSFISQFKLHFDDNDDEVPSCFKKWVEKLVTRGLEHLVIEDSVMTSHWPIKLPVRIFMCETLVHLKLDYVELKGFSSVSLPRLETMCLTSVWLSDEDALERFISASPVLHSLDIQAVRNVYELRVRSKTLESLSIMFCNRYYIGSDRKYGLVVDSPTLKDLYLEDDEFGAIVLNSVGSSTKMDIDVFFDIEVLRSFLVGISKVVKDLKLSLFTLKAIYSYSRLETLPELTNLTSLYASFSFGTLEMLPTFLESCPNLKYLYLDLKYPVLEKFKKSVVPRCMLTSLEFVEIKSSIGYYEDDNKLVGYILANAEILEKLTLTNLCKSRDRSRLLERVLMLPRRSSTCRVFVT